MPFYNDLNLKNWKNLDIWTDSLWVIPERDKTGKHSGFYHGNFIPQIPRQFISRYTKKDEIVLDPFVGSGTTAYEAETLKRNFIGIHIKNDLIERIRGNIDSKDNFFELLNGDSANQDTFLTVKNILEEKNNQGFSWLYCIRLMLI